MQKTGLHHILTDSLQRLSEIMDGKCLVRIWDIVRVQHTLAMTVMTTTMMFRVFKPNFAT